MSDIRLPPSSSVAPTGCGPRNAGTRARDLLFVRRMHVMRTLGMGLGFICVASVIRLRSEPWSIWALLAANGFLWPHVAILLASRSARPKLAEVHNLRLDSIFGGAWIALMHFSLLPSVLLLTMLSADKLTVGGWRFAVSSTTALVLSALATSAALGFVIDAATPTPVVVASMPLLIVYPLALSIVMHGLSNRIAAQNRRLEQLNSTDELTGLANRRQGYAMAAHALALHRRDRSPAVLIVVDIDQFKDVNDGYGHPAGDGVLRAVSALLRSCARATDTVARLSGDEFLLVLPDTDLRGGGDLAARIRSTLATTVFEGAPGLRCTVSLGASQAHRFMVDVEDWMQQADAALYRAKNDGRDRLMCAPTIEDIDEASNRRFCAAGTRQRVG